MKRTVFLLLFLFLFSGICSAAPGKTVFGPVQYDVKERYGRDNRYKDAFRAAEGRFVIKLQNGNLIPERSEFIDFKLNGETLLTDGMFDYGFIGCVVNLKKENSFEILLKDAKPSGLKRPQLPARFVTVTVLPLELKIPDGVYGVNDWEALRKLAGLLQKIANPESAFLAVSAVNLQHDVAARAQAMRKLSDRRDASALPFIAAVFNDTQVSPEVRAEAALALGSLGDKGSIPLLINGMLDPEEKTRLGSVRALSFYSEEDTREPLSKALERLDSMRRDAVMRSIASAGWKPVGTLIMLVESSDPYVSSMAIAMLGSCREPHATALLVKLFQQPGGKDMKSIITAIGQTGDRSALELVAVAAKDPARRAGNEAELGEALAGLGDPKYKEVIAEMIRKTTAPAARARLQAAYRKLAGKEY